VVEYLLHLIRLGFTILVRLQWDRDPQTMMLVGAMATPLARENKSIALYQLY
jgi:hypothetical protein